MSNQRSRRCSQQSWVTGLPIHTAREIGIEFMSSLNSDTQVISGFSRSMVIMLPSYSIVKPFNYGHLFSVVNGTEPKILPPNV